MNHVPAGIATLTQWDLQQAEVGFSEIVRRARTEAPQLVTARGAGLVVVVSAEHYAALAARRPLTFDDLRLHGGDGIDIERDTTPAIDRDIDLSRDQ